MGVKDVYAASRRYFKSPRWNGRVHPESLVNDTIQMIPILHVLDAKFRVRGDEFLQFSSELSNLRPVFSQMIEDVRQSRRRRITVTSMSQFQLRESIGRAENSKTYLPATTMRLSITYQPMVIKRCACGLFCSSVSQDMTSGTSNFICRVPVI
jgi:hypothetical protein